MKHEVFVFGGQRIDQKSKEARGNEERDNRGDEKGSHCFLKSTSWSSSIKIWVFFKLILKCHGVKKYVPLVNRM